MRPSLVVLGALLALLLLVSGLVWWVRSGSDQDAEADADAAIEINYVDLEGEDQGVVLVSRRPGNLLEFADFPDLESESLDVQRQETPIPMLPDIAATPSGLVIVDGSETVLLASGVATPLAAADAVVWAGGNWVWHIGDVGDGRLEAVLIDASGAAPSGEPVTVETGSVRAAPGLGLVVGDEVLGADEWQLGDVEVLAGGPAGLLIADGAGFFTLDAPDAAPLAVAVPATFAEATFTALSPGLSHVVAIERERAALVDLRSGDEVEIRPVVANPLRYGWLPDGSGLIWMSAGEVFMLEVGDAEPRELGAATVAFSYGNLEVLGPPTPP